MVLVQIDIPKDINKYLDLKTVLTETGDKRITIINILKEKMYSDKIMKEVRK